MKHDDDFTRVGDLLPMLIPAARDIKPRRKPKAITKAQIDLLNATAAHQAQEYGSGANRTAGFARVACRGLRDADEQAEEYGGVVCWAAL
jgi:hypothetical protein